jgi:hypothetical protein
VAKYRELFYSKGSPNEDLESEFKKDSWKCSKLCFDKVYTKDSWLCSKLCFDKVYRKFA